MNAQYEDVRCKCICPDTAVVNGTQSHRKLYIENVPPNKCDCTNVVLPRVGDDIKGKEKEFCPRCECKYESRNTTTIKVKVIDILLFWKILSYGIKMIYISGCCNYSYLDNFSTSHIHAVSCLSWSPSQ